jgi:hypothetical protein
LLDDTHHSAQTYINSINRPIAVSVIVHLCSICSLEFGLILILQHASCSDFHLAHLIQYYSLHTIPGSYNMFCFDFGTVQGDVYPVESYESLSVNHVLDAHWGVLDDDDVSIEICI